MAQNLKFIHLASEFTRPANTTAYGTNKVVSDGATTTLNCIRVDGQSTYPLTVGASYQVKSVALCVNSSGTTNASFDVYLYTSGVTAIADAGSFQLSYNNKHIRIGKTTVTLATADTNSVAAEGVNTDVNHVFKAETSTLSFFVVTTAAYTPTSASKWFLEVELLRIDE